jgi:hypothetical protein
MELILQGGYQVKLKEEKIEVNVPVPVRKVLQDIKMDTSKNTYQNKNRSISIG